jgi:succinoglycan biosynthesis transport protein ExoP
MPEGHRPPRREALDYLEILLRRPRQVLIPLVLVAIAAVAASYLVPARYRSSTLILVDGDQVPDAIAGKVVPERLGHRLQTLKQQVLSRTRLETVIGELDPYHLKGQESMTRMVDWMRGSIEVAVKGTDSFGIDYVHNDPVMAQRVANRLTQLFIDETIHARKEQVDEAYRFIETELEDARRQLAAREEALRRYKEEHMGTLPEQLNANLSTLQRLQMEQQGVSESLRAARDRAALFEQADARVPSTAPETELQQLRSQLASLRLRYTEDHPDIRALLSRIEAAQRGGSDGLPAGERGQNSQLFTARLEIKELQTRRDDLTRQIESFQSRVEQTPRTEQQIVTLTRDFQKLNENYLALLNKKLDTQMAARLEQRWHGDRFRILDPANLPERPYFPNRLLFLLCGSLAGLAAGLAVALMADHLDHSIRSVPELEAALPFPVLATLPRIFQGFGRASRGRRLGKTEKPSGADLGVFPPDRRAERTKIQ